MRIMCSLPMLIAVVSLFHESATASETAEVVTAPRAAKPILIVPPKFPSGQRIESGRVTVEVIGRIQRDGHLRIRSMTGDKPFKAEVSKVIAWWRFTPAMNR